MEYKANDTMKKAIQNQPESQIRAKKEAIQALKNLFDEDSFIELDSLISSRDELGNYKDVGAGVISAYGKIDGRLVFAIRQIGEHGGGVSSAQVKKMSKTVTNAITAGAPLITFFDSRGAKLEEGCHLLRSYARLMKSYGRAKGVVPLISVILGSCYGANAIMADYADFILTIRDKTGLFLAGPAEIKDQVSSFYGSAKQISASGASDIICEDEESVFLAARSILSYMPGNRFERAPRYQPEPMVELDEDLLKYADLIEAGAPYDMKVLMSKFADREEILFVAEDYGPRAASAFCRIGGVSVGVISNLMIEGDTEPVLDITSLDKIKRFIKICDNFNIPILSVVDVTGFSSTDETQALDLMAGATRLSTVLSAIDVPFVSVIVGRAYGSAYLSMGVKDQCVNIAYTWPKAKISLIEPRAGALIMGRDSIDPSGDISEQRKNLIESFLQNNCSAELAAASGIVDDILDPLYTRYRLIDVFDILQSKRSEHTLKKLGF